MPPREYQDVAPEIFFPKRNKPINNKMVMRYRILAKRSKNLDFAIRITPPTNRLTMKNKNCFPTGILKLKMLEFSLKFVE